MSPLLTGVFASGVSGHLFTGPTGAYDALGSVTVGAGGQSSITFSAIPQTYTHLQLRIMANDTASGGGNNNFMQFNGDSGSNYDWHFLQGNGSTTAAGSSSIPTSSIIIGKDGYTSSGNGVTIIDIVDYANTYKYKTVRSLNGTDFNGSGTLFFSSGLWQNTAAINSLVITTAGTAFAQYSNFSLYGIR